MTRARLTQVVVVSAALAVSGGALATGQDGSDPAPPPPQDAVRQVDPEQSSRYAVLRRERVATDELPADHRGFVDDQMTKDNGAAARLSRRATNTPSGRPVFVLPGRGWICVYAVRGEGGSGGCNRTSEALKGYIVGTSAVAPGVTQVVGLVPDGVSEVRLVGKDGSVERAAPDGNAFVFETARLPRSVQWGDVAIDVVSPHELG